MSELVFKTGGFGHQILQVITDTHKFSLASDNELVIFDEKEDTYGPTAFVSTGEELLEKLAEFLGYHVSKRYIPTPEQQGRTDARDAVHNAKNMVEDERINGAPFKGVPSYALERLLDRIESYLVGNYQDMHAINEPSSAHYVFLALEESYRDPSIGKEREAKGNYWATHPVEPCDCSDCQHVPGEDEELSVDSHKLGFCHRFAVNESCVGCGDARNGVSLATEADDSGGPADVQSLSEAVPQ